MLFRHYFNINNWYFEIVYFISVAVLFFITHIHTHTNRSQQTAPTSQTNCLRLTHSKWYTWFLPNSLMDYVKDHVIGYSLDQNWFLPKKIMFGLDEMENDCEFLYVVAKCIFMTVFHKVNLDDNLIVSKIQTSVLKFFCGNVFLSTMIDFQTPQDQGTSCSVHSINSVSLCLSLANYII